MSPYSTTACLGYGLHPTPPQRPWSRCRPHYCLANGEFKDEDLDNALILADLAALTIERSGAAEYIEEVGLSAEEPQTWAHSAVAHNASGMVSVQLSIGVEEALLRLRALAFASNRSVADIAEDVVARRLRSDHEAQC